MKYVKSSNQWAAIHSSKRNNWRTPPKLFNVLNQEFGFTLDAAADAENALCKTFLTESDDALSLENGAWANLAQFGSIWCNPPYGRGIDKWIDRGIVESSHGSKVVMLTFACTETRWFSKAWSAATEIRFIQGRLNFIDPDTLKAFRPAPKGSCIFVFEPNSLNKTPIMSLFKAHTV